MTRYDVTLCTLEGVARQLNIIDPETKTLPQFILDEANGGNVATYQIKQMMEDQRYKCAYCTREVKLTIDHIVPIRQGDF